MGKWKHSWNRKDDDDGPTTYGQKDYAVRLVDLEDKEVSVHFPPPSTWAFEKLAELYQVVKATKKGFVDTLMVPVEHALWLTRQRVAPLACAFHATKGVLKNLHGVEFSKEDEEWFLGHGLLKPGGLPFPDTFRVIQGLISPYGFRIARVRVAPGFQIKGNMLEWRPILGMNPMALQDRGTTNAEYAEQTGQPLAQVNNLYRMEYNPEPFQAGVVCEADDKNEFGHASYAAPRRRATGRELLSYQISRVASDPWTLTEPEWPYVEAETEEVLDVWAMIRAAEPTKKVPMPAPKSAKGESDEGWMDPKPLKPRLELVEDAASEAGGMKLLAFTNSGKCVMCGLGDVPKSDPICPECWVAIWDGYQCSATGCGVHFYKRPPVYDGVNYPRGELKCICARCKAPNELPAKDDIGAQMALRALAGRFTKKDRKDWGSYVQFQGV